MKLSSKNGHPFMIFEIISRTVRPCAAACVLCASRAAVCLTTLTVCVQGDLLMTSLQEMPVRLLDTDEHASTVGACQTARVRNVRLFPSVRTSEPRANQSEAGSSPACTAPLLNFPVPTEPDIGDPKVKLVVPDLRTLSNVRPPACA
jgi:hypothetical protein